MKYLDNPLDISIVCILIGITFSTIIALSSPALYLTDEWITANQLHQLSNGSQLLNTEGKYGRLFTGETSLYFTTRGNYLAYSLFLPVISLPALKLLMFFKDYFRLGILMTWGIITLLSLLLVMYLLSKAGRIRAARMVYIPIGAFMLFFLLNLITYTPFPASYEDSPIESAAVVLTNEILLSLMAGVLFLLYLNILKNRRMAIGAALITLFCSSYLFWSSTGKDHILLVFLLSCSLLLSSEVVKNPAKWKDFLFFITLGLIGWARPELGFFILGGGTLWFLIRVYRGNPGRSEGSSRFYFVKKFSPVLGIFVGLLPFFINNAFFSGNPFIPTQILYLQERGMAQDQASLSATLGNFTSETGYFQSSFMEAVLNFFTPELTFWIQDLPGIFFYPKTGAAGILFVCPIIIPALFSLITWTKRKFTKFSEIEKEILIYTSILCTIIFVSYLRGLHGLNTSMGIYPDIRYLSPLYLCFTIISVIILYKAELVSGDFLVKPLIIASLFIPALLIAGMILFEPFGGLLLGQYQFLWVLGYLLVLISCAIIVLPLQPIRKRRLFSLVLAFLAIIPLTWQVMLISLYAVIKMNGYPYWLPVSEFIMNTFLVSIR